MSKPLRILVACEFSGAVRDAFAALGHEVWSCDLLPTEQPGLHYVGDVRHLLEGWVPVRHQCECDPGGEGCCRLTGGDTSECPCLGPTQDEVEYKETEFGLFGRPVDRPHWDMLIAFPPCTYLCSSGMHWTTRGLRDPQLTEDALAFVEALWAAPIPRIAIENPVGAISTRSSLGKASQTIQPHHFGHDASKRTCLWLRNLPPLVGSDHVPPRMVNGKPRWANQTDSGQNRLGPSADRWALRSLTYPGIAQAMANQWSTLT